jgi:hypothetical protein
LKLKNRQKVDSILKEMNDNPEIKVFNLLNENKLDINDIISKANLRNSFDNLKLENDKLEVEFFLCKGR